MWCRAGLRWWRILTLRILKNATGPWPISRRSERIHAAFVDACGRNDGTDAITQDNLFHDAIVRGAHNEYVEEFSHTMILHIQRIKYHYFHCDRLRKISVSQHGEILQTIQARDSARAKELMRSHWLCSMENSLRDVAGMIHGVGGESGQDVLTK